MNIYLAITLVVFTVLESPHAEARFKMPSFKIPKFPRIRGTAVIKGRSTSSSGKGSMAFGELVSAVSSGMASSQDSDDEVIVTTSTLAPPKRIIDNKNTPSSNQIPDNNLPNLQPSVHNPLGGYGYNTHRQFNPPANFNGYNQPVQYPPGGYGYNSIGQFRPQFSTNGYNPSAFYPPPGAQSDDSSSAQPVYYKNPHSHEFNNSPDPADSQAPTDTAQSEKPSGSGIGAMLQQAGAGSIIDTIVQASANRILPGGISGSNPAGRTNDESVTSSSVAVSTQLPIIYNYYTNGTADVAMMQVPPAIYYQNRANFNNYMPIRTSNITPIPNAVYDSNAISLHNPAFNSDSSARFSGLPVTVAPPIIFHQDGIVSNEDTSTGKFGAPKTTEPPSASSFVRNQDEPNSGTDSPRQHQHHIRPHNRRRIQLALNEAFQKLASVRHQQDEAELQWKRERHDIQTSFIEVERELEGIRLQQSSKQFRER